MKLETKIIKGMRKRYIETNGGLETIFNSKQNAEKYKQFLTVLLEWNIKDSDIFQSTPKKKLVRR